MTLNTEAFAKALAAGIAAYEAASKENGWIEWPGGDCPVAPTTLVDVKFRDGSGADGEPANWWNWDAYYAPIIAYRLAA